MHMERTDNDHSNRPLLFNYANKELEQDAFICWLLANAEGERIPGNAVQSVGRRFIQMLFEKIGRSLDLSDRDALFVEVYKQIYNADAVARVKYKEMDVTLVIEDKVSAEVYNDIPGYVGKVKNDERFKDSEVLPLIMRTGDDKRESVIPYFLRADFLALFEGNMADCENSEILFDFYRHLKKIDDTQNTFRTSPLKEWSWESWKGLYSALMKADPDNSRMGLTWWGYVANANGGFMAMGGKSVWFGGHTLHLQIEHDKRAVCLKIGEVYENNKSEIRDDMIERINGILNRHPEFMELGLVPPQRRGCGCYMTLKRINAENWLGSDDEVVNFESVVAKLKKCYAFLNFLGQELNQSE